MCHSLLNHQENDAMGEIIVYIYHISPPTDDPSDLPHHILAQILEF